LILSHRIALVIDWSDIGHYHPRYQVAGGSLGRGGRSVRVISVTQITDETNTIRTQPLEGWARRSFLVASGFGMLALGTAGLAACATGTL
jgi:hypothetical protein